MPAAAADSRAARSASSSVCNTRLNSSSSDLGSGFAHAPDVTASAHPPWRRRPAARGPPPGPSPRRRARRTSRRTPARAAGRRRHRWWAISCSTTSSRSAHVVCRSGTAIAAPSVVTLVVRGGDSAPRSRASAVQRRASARGRTRARARRRRSAARSPRRRTGPPAASVRLVPKNSIVRLPCSLARSNKRPDEFLCRVDLRALRVARAHRSSARARAGELGAVTEPGASACPVACPPRRRRVARRRTGGAPACRAPSTSGDRRTSARCPCSATRSRYPGWRLVLLGRFSPGLLAGLRQPLADAGTERQLEVDAAR